MTSAQHCSQPGCGNQTLDSSGRCQHHRQHYPGLIFPLFGSTAETPLALEHPKEDERQTWFDAGWETEEVYQMFRFPSVPDGEWAGSSARSYNHRIREVGSDELPELTMEKAEEWYQALKGEDPAAWIFYGFTPEEASAWTSARRRPHRSYPYKVNSLGIADAIDGEQAHRNRSALAVTPNPWVIANGLRDRRDARKWAKDVAPNIQNPLEVKRAVDANMDLEEAIRWVDDGWDPKEAARLSKRGLSLADAGRLYQLKSDLSCTESLHSCLAFADRLTDIPDEDVRIRWAMNFGQHNRTRVASDNYNVLDVDTIVRMHEAGWSPEYVYPDRSIIQYAFDSEVDGQWWEDLGLREPKTMMGWKSEVHMRDFRPYLESCDGDVDTAILLHRLSK